jgi:AcrR family transcriptional regulator
MPARIKTVPRATRRAPEPAAPPVPAANVDHRVRVADEKRGRMRERLVGAAMDAFLAIEPGRHPVIDDVIRIAEVSRGTFYKYYGSLDELLADIGRQMADEMLSSFERMFGATDDAPLCLAAGPLMAMARAVMEPRHAAFIARVDFVEFLDGEDPRSLIVARSLTRARDDGGLHFDSIEAATDLVIGASLESARRLLKTRRMDAAYIREVAALVMQGLGMPRAAAQQCVAAAWQTLQKNSAGLAWWRPVAGL